MKKIPVYRYHNIIFISIHYTIDSVLYMTLQQNMKIVTHAVSYNHQSVHACMPVGLYTHVVYNSYIYILD